MILISAGSTLSKYFGGGCLWNGASCTYNVAVGEISDFSISISLKGSVGFSGYKHNQNADNAAAAIAEAKSQCGSPICFEAHWSQSDPGTEADWSFSPE